MLKNKFCYSFIVTLIFISLYPAVSKAENVSKPPWALEIISADNKEPLKISVILKNISQNPQKIWKESNSWGYSISLF